MATIDDVAQSFYDSLGASETAALKRMAIAHQRALDALTTQFEHVNAIIEQDAALGLDSGAYILQQQRLASLVTQAAHEYSTYGGHVGLELTQLQKDAVTLAKSFVPAALGAQDDAFSAAAFGQLPTSAITQFVGYLGDGSPLRDLTNAFGNDIAKQLNATLLTGVATGANPRVIARQMLATAQDFGKARAETLARTEMMRTFRESARRTMQKNSGIVKGWRWWSALDKRTCPVCYAMHGKTFPLSESMATHPNCRCMQMPITYSFRQLGINADDAAALSTLNGSGEDAFRALDEATQRAILGKGAFLAWQRGFVTLDDFVLDTYSPAWGYGRRTKSLREMVGGENARLLSAGKVPANLTPTNFKLTLPDVGDEFISRRSKLANMLEDGLLPASDVNGFLAAIDAGKFPTLDELDVAIQARRDQLIAYAESVIDEAITLGVQDANAGLQFLDDFANGVVRIEDAEAVLANAQAAIDAEKIAQQQAAQLALDHAKASLRLELDKAKLLGNVDDFEYQTYLDDITHGNLSVVEYNNIEQGLAYANTANDAFADALAAAKDAHAKGFLDSAAYQQAESSLTSYSVSLQDAKDLKTTFDTLIQENATLVHPATQAPDAYNKLTALYNNKKLSFSEYQQVLSDINAGTYTKKTFTEFVDDLETKLANKVTKTSQQLLAELDATYYTDAEKQLFKQQYQFKQINKEQLQDILNAAPATPPVPAPPANTLFADKYKAQDALYDLQGQGKITFAELDAWNQKMWSIGPGYSEQQFINDVEQFIKQFPTPPANTGTVVVHNAADALQEISKALNAGDISVADYNSFYTKYNSIGNGVYTESDFVHDVNAALQNIQKVNTPIAVPSAPYTPPVYKPTLPTVPPSKTVSFVTKNDVYTYAQNEYYNGSITYKQWDAIRSKAWDIGSIQNGKVFSESDYIKWAEKKLNVNQTAKTKGLPYKKHLNELDSMITQGVITQAEKDQIIDLYQAGKFKNADIESWIDQTNKAAQYQTAGGGFSGPHPVWSSLNDPFEVKHYNWGYSNYRQTVSKQEVKAWRGSVSRDAFQVVQDYTGGDYTAINEHLRGKTPSSRIRAREQYIQEAFASPHARITQDVVSVRGTKVPNADRWVNTPVGGVTWDDGILSTSVDTNGAWNANPSRADHTGLELIVFSPTGTNAIYTESFSNHPGEQELSFPPGGKFLVMGRTERPYGPSKIVRLVVQALP